MEQESEKMEINSLRRLRALRGLTLRELSEKSKVNSATISLLEQGHNRATLRTIGKLAGALGVQMDDMLDIWDNDSQRKKQGALKREASRRTKEENPKSPGLLATAASL